MGRPETQARSEGMKHQMVTQDHDSEGSGSTKPGYRGNQARRVREGWGSGALQPRMGSPSPHDKVATQTERPRALGLSWPGQMQGMLSCPASGPGTPVLRGGMGAGEDGRAGTAGWEGASHTDFRSDGGGEPSPHAMAGVCVSGGTEAGGPRLTLAPASHCGESSLTPEPAPGSVLGTVPQAPQDTLGLISWPGIFCCCFGLSAKRNPRFTVCCRCWALMFRNSSEVAFISGVHEMYLINKGIARGFTREEVCRPCNWPESGHSGRVGQLPLHPPSHPLPDRHPPLPPIHSPGQFWEAGDPCPAGSECPAPCPPRRLLQVSGAHIGLSVTFTSPGFSTIYP